MRISVKNKVSVSIVLPIYNVAEYLDECLHSIFVQSFNDFEVIMVNDGSTDASEKIAQTYADKDSRFKLISKINGGLSSARNVGIENAKGQYICFVDSDDFIHNDYLKVMYEAAIKQEADMVFADYHEIAEDGTDLKKSNGKCPYIQGNIQKKILLEALASVGENHYATAVVVAWNKLIRTDIMKKLRYKEGVIHEDEFIIMPLLLLCEKCVWVEADIYAYRQRRSGIMQSEKQAYAHLKILEAFEERIKFCEKINDNALHKKFVMSYFWDLEIWYFLMREKYNIPSHKIYFFFTNKMRKHLIRYFKVLRKRKIYEYGIFTISPEYYLKHFYH